MNQITEKKFPQTLRFKDWTCTCRLTCYHSDRDVPCLILYADSDQRAGERIAVASVNLSGNATKLAPGEVAIKGWSENEGMADALIKAGIIGPELRKEPTGFVLATIHQLIESP